MLKIQTQWLSVLAGLLAFKLVHAQTSTNEEAKDSARPEKPEKNYAQQKPLTASAACPAADATNRFTIYMSGDSTMANKPVLPAHPERGWGQMLPQYFQSGVRIENHAMNGRSTKSFIDEGRWSPVRERLKPGDWLIIQFGHNDEKGKGALRFTEPFGQFKTNLTMFIVAARARGANPILCTSIARRKFDAHGDVVNTHGDYIAATREVATEQKVPLLDLNKRSTELLRTLGVERSKIIYDWFTTSEIPTLKKDLVDDTHFNAFGASRMCDFAVEEMKTATPELARYLNTAK